MSRNPLRISLVPPDVSILTCSAIDRLIRYQNAYLCEGSSS